MTIPCAVKPGFYYTVYPCGIDNTTIPVVVDDQTPVTAEIANRLREGVLSTQFELGTNPSGTYTTVSSRLTALEELVTLVVSGNSLIVKQNGVTTVPGTNTLNFINATVVNNSGVADITVPTIALTASAPAAVTKAAAAVGVATDAARADHKHDISTAIASSLSVGGSNAEGTATSLARSDHTHSLPAFGTSAGTFAQGDDSRFTDDRTASGLRTATTIVSVSAATAPIAGQALVATSDSTATWQSVGGSGNSGWDAVVTTRAELVAQGVLSGTLTITNKRLFIAGDIVMNAGEAIILSGECALGGRGIGTFSRIRGDANLAMISVASGSTAIIESIEIGNVNTGASAYGVRLRANSIIRRCRIRAIRGVSPFGANIQISQNIFDTASGIGPAQTALVAGISVENASNSTRVMVINNQTALDESANLAMTYVFIDFQTTSGSLNEYVIQGNQIQGWAFIRAELFRTNVSNNVFRYISTSNDGGFIIAFTSSLVINSSTVALNTLERLVGTSSVTGVAFLRCATLSGQAFLSCVFGQSSIIGNRIKNERTDGAGSWNLATDFGFFKSSATATVPNTVMTTGEVTDRDAIVRENTIKFSNGSVRFYNESTLQAGGAIP